jgi:tetratricopeptide (TPR) repeat protein
MSRIEPRAFAGRSARRGLWLLAAVTLPALRAMPGDAATDWRFIEQLRAQGMHDAAARELVRFAEQHPADPRTPVALLDAGAQFERLEQWPLALAAYERLLLDQPQAAEVPLALGRQAELLAKLGQFSAAVEAYRSLLIGSASPAQREAAQLGMAEALMALGQEQDARRNLLHVLSGATAATAARARFDLGLLHLRAAADSLAIEQFDLAAQVGAKEPIAAFALLRAADRLTELGDRVGAQQRYARVLADFDAAPLRIRAHLGLAQLAREAADANSALSHSREVVAAGGTREQTALGWIGVAQAALELGDLELVEHATGEYLAGDPAAADRNRARLLRAQAMRARSHPAAVDSLRALTALSQAELVHAAWIELALAAQTEGEEVAALAAWRQAARAAPDGDGAAEALLAEAALLASESTRTQWASQVAEEAARQARSPSVAARALWQAAQRAREASQLARAHQLATRLVTEYPLSEQAQVAELMRRQLSEAMRYDVRAAARELAQLAGREDLTPYARALAVGRIERDRLGELDRAVQSFERAAALAATSAEHTLSACELARTRERAALAAALDGSEETARSTMLAAMRGFSDAAKSDGGEASAAAELGSLRLELALAAAPAAPWFFDAAIAPLRGGVGAVEALDLSEPRFDSLRTRIAATRSARAWTGDEAAWLLWRQAELTTEDARTALELLESALGQAQDAALRDGLFLTRAQWRIAAGDAESALADLRMLTQKAQGETALAARYLLAEQERAARRHATAEQLYLQFAGAVPRTQTGERALLLAGDCAFFLGEPERAASRYRELLERDEASVYADDALYRLATAEMRLGRREAAREQLLRLLQWERDSDYAGRALLRLAELAQKRGEFAASADYLAQLVQRDRELAVREDAMAQLAGALLLAARPGEAQQWLERRETEQGIDASGLVLRVRTEAARRDWDAARATLLRLGKDFESARAARAEAELELAEALAAASQPQAAQAHFRAAAELDAAPSSSARAAFGLGLLAAGAGDLTAARAQFERVAQPDPDGSYAAPALWQLGQLHQRARDAERAQTSYAELARRHAKHALAPDALRAEARVWKELGRYDAALDCYRRLLEGYPSQSDAAELLAQIAYCQHELGQFEASIATYRRVMPELPEDERGYAQFWVADGYAQMGRHAEAASEFLRIPFLYPKLGELPVTAELKAGEAYEQAGDLDAARQLYERVLKQHGPGSTWGVEARKRIDRTAAAAAGGD